MTAISSGNVTSNGGYTITANLTVEQRKQLAALFDLLMAGGVGTPTAPQGVALASGEVGSSGYSEGMLPY